MESAEGSTCFGESGVDLIVNDYSAGKRTAKVGELVNRIESLPVDGNVGFYIMVFLERVGASPRSSWY